MWQRMNKSLKSEGIPMATELGPRPHVYSFNQLPSLQEVSLQRVRP